MTYCLGVPGFLWVLIIVTITFVPVCSVDSGKHMLTGSWSYQLDPWGSQGPWHCQQNPALQVLHTMWLQPPFFSIVAWHLGHSLVLQWIQFDVSLSSSHFLCQRLRYSQRIGSWGSRLHRKLKKKTCMYMCVCVCVWERERERERFN